jgi:hypothetical protein
MKKWTFALLLTGATALPLAANEPDVAIEPEVEIAEIEVIDDPALYEVVDPLPEEFTTLELEVTSFEGEEVAYEGEEIAVDYEVLAYETEVIDDTGEIVEFGGEVVDFVGEEGYVPGEEVFMTFGGEGLEGEIHDHEHGAIDDVCKDLEHCDHLLGDCVHGLPYASGVADGEELMLYSFSTTGLDGEAMPDRGPIQPHFRNLGGIEQASANAFVAPVNVEGPRGLLQENQLRATDRFGRDITDVVGQSDAAREPGLFGRLLVRNVEPAAVSEADRSYAGRLAVIDELRDRALATGNEELLREADRREQELKNSNEPRGLRLFRR